MRRLNQLLILAVVGFVSGAGITPAHAGGFLWFGDDKGDDCDDGYGADKPRWHSEEWYAQYAHLPPGERPRIKHGKLTPVEPRPDLPKQPCCQLYHDVKNWPHPYDCVDRNIVRSAYAVTTQKGWMNLATLHDFHFDERTHMLNGKGVAKVRYILNGFPSHIRAIYVADQRSAVTTARIANVQASLVDLAGPGNGVSVMPRVAQPGSRPAIEVETINRSRLERLLPPVITYDAAVTGGGGGGGAGP